MGCPVGEDVLGKAEGVLDASIVGETLLMNVGDSLEKIVGASLLVIVGSALFSIVGSREGTVDGSEETLMVGAEVVDVIDGEAERADEGFKLGKELVCMEVGGSVSIDVGLGVGDAVASTKEFETSNGVSVVEVSCTCPTHLAELIKINVKHKNIFILAKPSEPNRNFVFSSFQKSS